MQCLKRLNWANWAELKIKNYFDICLIICKKLLKKFLRKKNLKKVKGKKFGSIGPKCVFVKSIT